jgi:SAM-dependent methyltransferase
MTDGPPTEPWWHSFFDATYADIGLRDEPERQEAVVDFLVEHLRLEPGDRVLDQCCGVGRISLPLARRGVDVVGVDQAAGYVERARERAEAEKLPCRFHAGDAMKFVAPEPCDGAFNWFTSFGYSEDDDENVRMLERAFESLRPGGRFVLEYQNVPRILAEFRDSFVERSLASDGKPRLMIVESKADFRRGMINGLWTIIHPDGRREPRVNSTRILMPHELVRMLERCGFGEIELFGSVEAEAFDRKSRRLIAVATRPE